MSPSPAGVLLWEIRILWSWKQAQKKRKLAARERHPTIWLSGIQMRQRPAHITMAQYAAGSLHSEQTGIGLYLDCGDHLR
jgi:hypothetical protein